MDLKEFARTILRAIEHQENGHNIREASRRACLLEAHSERWIEPIEILLQHKSAIEHWAEAQADWRKPMARRNRRR